MKSKIVLILSIAATICITSCSKEKKHDSDLSVNSSYDQNEESSGNHFDVTENEKSENLNLENSYENNEQNISSTGSSNYDKMLDDYEEYVTQYIEFYKKAQRGDNSALAEYPSMMQKAVNLQESMEKAQNDNELSSAQVARMMRIQTKMVEGMQ